MHHDLLKIFALSGAEYIGISYDKEGVIKYIYHLYDIDPHQIGDNQTIPNACTYWGSGDYKITLETGTQIAICLIDTFEGIITIDKPALYYFSTNDYIIGDDALLFIE